MPDRRELVLLFAAAATAAGVRAGGSAAASEATLAELSGDALDPRDYGAVGDGTTNDQTALQNCLTDAASLGKPVFIPPLTFAHSSTLTATGVRVFGAGWKSVLKATTASAAAFRLRGDGAAIESVRLTCPGATRQTDTPGAGIDVQATRFVVRGCWVDAFGNAGIKLSRVCTYGLVTGNLVENCGGDGIFVVEQATHIRIAENTIRTVGEDAIGIIAYLDAGIPTPSPRHIAVVGNTIQGPMDPRGAVVMQGITAFGAHDVTIAGNTVDSVEGAGIAVASWDNRGITERVQVVGNTVRNVSTDVTEPIKRFGAMRLFGRSATNKTRHVTVVGNSFHGNKYGVEVGQHTEDILVADNFIDPGAGSADTGIRVWNIDNLGATRATDVVLINNSIAGAGGRGIDVDYCTGLLEISGNRFRDINTSRTAGLDVIRVTANVTTSRIEIIGNKQLGPAQPNTHKFVELGSGISAVAERNYSEAGLANDAGA
jgi:hypothetical protein